METTLLVSLMAIEANARHEAEATRLLAALPDVPQQASTLVMATIRLYRSQRMEAYRSVCEEVAQHADNPVLKAWALHNAASSYEHGEPRRNELNEQAATILELLPVEGPDQPRAILLGKIRAGQMEDGSRAMDEAFYWLITTQMIHLGVKDAPGRAVFLAQVFIEQRRHDDARRLLEQVLDDPPGTFSRSQLRRARKALADMG